MRDRLVAAIRTSVQVAVGFGVAWLVGALSSVGIDIAIGSDVVDQIANGVSLVLGAVIVGVWVFVQSALESRFPWLAKVLSLGLSKTGPTYN